MADKQDTNLRFWIMGILATIVIALVSTLVGLGYNSIMAGITDVKQEVGDVRFELRVVQSDVDEIKQKMARRDEFQLYITERMADHEQRLRDIEETMR